MAGARRQWYEREKAESGFPGQTIGRDTRNCPGGTRIPFHAETLWYENGMIVDAIRRQGPVTNPARRNRLDQLNE